MSAAVTKNRLGRLAATIAENLVHPGFQQSVRDVRSLRIEQWFDLTPVVRS
jgi:virulence-associated protein VapD